MIKRWFIWAVVVGFGITACSDNSATFSSQADLLDNTNAEAMNLDGTEPCEGLEITPEEWEANEGLDPSMLEETEDILDFPWWQPPWLQSGDSHGDGVRGSTKNADAIQEDGSSEPEKAEFHQILPSEKNTRHFCAWHLGAGPLCSYFKEFHRNMWWKHIKTGSWASYYRGYKKVP